MVSLVNAFTFDKCLAFPTSRNRDVCRLISLIYELEKAASDLKSLILTSCSSHVFLNLRLITKGCEILLIFIVLELENCFDLKKALPSSGIFANLYDHFN